MKIVAILQNAWFKNPDRVRAIFARHPESDRPALVKRFLFYKSLTGKRLKQAFGDELCGRIVWEEASKEIGGHSAAVFKFDARHIFNVLREHRPDVVVAFGQVASRGVAASLQLFAGQPNSQGFYVMAGPHPAARGATVMDDLLGLARRLNEHIDDSRRPPVNLFPAAPALPPRPSAAAQQSRPAQGLAGDGDDGRVR